MKKLFVLAVVAVMALGASAQNWYVGGSFGYEHKKVDDAKSDQFLITPEIGYNLNETWAIGANFGYQWVKDTYNLFAIEPYARYTYFRTDNNLLSLFVDGGVGLGFIDPEEGDSETVWSIGFQPGLALNITEKFSFVAHIGFLGYSDMKAAGKTYGVSLDGSDLSFGFYYNF